MNIDRLGDTTTFQRKILFRHRNKGFFSKRSRKNFKMSSSAEDSKDKYNSGKKKDACWREHGNLERQRHLLKYGHFSDCTLIVGKDQEKPEQFKCHKAILCHSSEVFETIFYGDHAEESIVKVEDIQSKYFYKMLEYIYTDNVDLESVDTALGVYHAAHKYLISPLCSMCHQFIKQKLSPFEVCKTLDFSRLINDHKLENLAVQKLREETAIILTANNFTDTEVTSLLTLLEQDELTVTSEIALFSACLNWAGSHMTEEKSLRQLLDPVLPFIRFKCISIKNFAEIVCSSKVLTEKEEHDILICLALDRGEMPHGFSNETKNRCNPLKTEFLSSPCTDLVTLTLCAHAYPFESNGPFDLCVSLETNLTDIFLRGVQLKRRFKTSYEDDVQVVYYNNGGQIIAYSNFKGQVSEKKCIELYFEPPYPALLPIHTITSSFSHNSTRNKSHEYEYQRRQHPRISVTYASTINNIPHYETSVSKYTTKWGSKLKISGSTTIGVIYLSAPGENYHA